MEAIILNLACSLVVGYIVNVFTNSTKPIENVAKPEGCPKECTCVCPDDDKAEKGKVMKTVDVFIIRNMGSVLFWTYIVTLSGYLLFVILNNKDIA